MAKKIEVYKIESDVPVPEYTNLPPMNNMEVGDSVLFNVEKILSVRSTASRIKRQTGKEFVVKRMSKEQGRVWRVK